MSWGDFLNSATGANASARKQYEYNKKLQNDAQEFAKWQMGNAHQMEMEDLEKARKEIYGEEKEMTVKQNMFRVV